MPPIDLCHIVDSCVRNGNINYSCLLDGHFSTTTTTRREKKERSDTDPGPQSIRLSNHVNSNPVF
jgi:hypothetical protein